MFAKLLRPGDLVQLSPEDVGNKAFAGCFMVVTEPHEWGAQGYVQGVGKTRDAKGDVYYYRATWEEMEYIGQSEWRLAE